MDRISDEELAAALERAYDENGVDRSLICWMLSLTPAQRLQCLQNSLELIARAKPVADEPR